MSGCCCPARRWRKLLATGPCPCGSGRTIRTCCAPADGGSFSPPRLRFGSTNAPTGFTNPRCFAGPLGDCVAKLSAEHYVSHALLKRLGKPGDKVTVSGMRVNGGAETALPPHALRANILCKRHNEQLSALDGMSASFIDTLSGDPRRGAFVSNNGHLLRHFSGRAMEAWFLKVALGLLVSGNASFPAKPDSWKPPVALLRILFRGETFAVPLGLYTVDQPGNGHHFQAQLFGDEQGLSAMKCVLANVVFVLIMTADVRPFARSVYRPPEFFRRELPPRIVRLIWDEPGANERIDIGF